MTGIVFDDTASDTVTKGFAINSSDVKPFEIDHANKDADQMEDEVWAEVAANSTHFTEFSRLFEKGSIVEAIDDQLSK